jgi:hypothetical protein
VKFENCQYKIQFTFEKACSADGGGERRVQWGNMREREHWGDPGVDGRIILNGS